MEISPKDSPFWLSAILETIREGVIGIDASGTVVWMNPAAERMTGWQEDKAMGRQLSAVFNPMERETQSPIEVSTQSVIHAGITIREQNRLLMISDQQPICVDFIVTPVIGDGDPIGSLIVLSECLQGGDGKQGQPPMKGRKVAVPERERSHRVLVMDDDDVVRTMTLQRLVRLGYDGEVAENGEDAVTKFRAARDSGRPFDVVVLDLMVRDGMGGKDTLDMLKQIDPDVRAVLASGHSADPALSNFWEYGFSGVIRKPFVMKELDMIIRQALEKI